MALPAGFVLDQEPVGLDLPSGFVLDQAAAAPAPAGDYRIPLGQANIARAGTDVTLISYGRQVSDCMSAANELAEQGVSAEVIDLRSLVPLDEATVLASVSKTKRAVVVHEAVTRCGFGAELSSRIHEELFGTLAAPVVRVGVKNIPIPYAKNLETAFVPQVSDIVDAVKSLNK